MLYISNLTILSLIKKKRKRKEFIEVTYTKYQILTKLKLKFRNIYMYFSRFTGFVYNIILLELIITFNRKYICISTRSHLCTKTQYTLSLNAFILFTLVLTRFRRQFMLFHNSYKGEFPNFPMSFKEGVFLLLDILEYFLNWETDQTIVSV